MKQTIILCLSFLAAFTINAQVINVRGKVTNQAGKPISGAVVTFLNKGLSDTTSSDGTYSIKQNIVAIKPTISHSGNISLSKGILELKLVNTSKVKIETFDLRGSLLKKEIYPKALSGVYHMNIAGNSPTTNINIVKVTINDQSTTFRFLPLQDGGYLRNNTIGNVFQHNGKLAKIAADYDSIETTADGYETKVLKIWSYDTVVDISLDTIKDVACEGCGKTNHPSSGKASIDVDGMKREYTLKIPDNYDPNKSYMLIFCFHWWGGNMDDVVNGGTISGPYYGLEKLGKGSAIFVSPQGLEDNGQPRGWANPNGRDIKFVKTLLNYLNSSLCIDQKRIFSIGFSYGGMMSYSIGCSMGNVFRAIAPMSGAFYSGCDKSTEDPIAVWMAHGTSDNVVPLSDGKTALSYFIEKNGCSKETIPVEPSPCVAYKGCKDGFPVIYCEFNGGHSTQSFAPAATWAFFNQF